MQPEVAKANQFRIDFPQIFGVLRTVIHDGNGPSHHRRLRQSGDEASAVPYDVGKSATWQLFVEENVELFARQAAVPLRDRDGMESRIPVPNAMVCGERGLYAAIGLPGRRGDDVAQKRGL